MRVGPGSHVKSLQRQDAASLHKYQAISSPSARPTQGGEGTSQRRHRKLVKNMTRASGSSKGSSRTPSLQPADPAMRVGPGSYVRNLQRQDTARRHQAMPTPIE